ncbi:MAG: hypothetical protein ACOYLO_06785 [Ferruginibacter sp.]
MKKKLLLFICFGFVTFSFAQKKVLLVTESTLTGIGLPNGSKKDSRSLSISMAKILLEMESKKNAATLSSTEVLTLPPVSSGGFNADSLVKNLTNLGWTITPNETDTKYAWLQKDNRFVITYFSMDKRETSLYFAEASSMPNMNAQGNTTVNTQTVSTQNDQQQQPVNTPVQNNQGGQDPQASQAISNSGFAFNTINFDDGWVATVQEDWVEVTKGNIKALLHYPKEGTIFPADPDVLTTAAWNILVAPRYSNLKNYKTAYISTYDRPYLGMGYATENATGKDVFIVLFRQGQSGWLEFVAPDKNSFIQQYKFDPETIRWDSESNLMIPLANMTGYNRFAVAASDFQGKWTSDFTGIQQLYNVYTGNYAGMHMNQSNEEFIFGKGGTYSRKLLVVNGMAGNAAFTQVKSSGQLTVPNNWQVHFTKIESSPKTYNAFWSCIKGARILNLLDAQYPGSGIYTKYGLAK